MIPVVPLGPVTEVYKRWFAPYAAQANYTQWVNAPYPRGEWWSTHYGHAARGPQLAVFPNLLRLAFDNPNTCHCAACVFVRNSGGLEAQYAKIYAQH